MPINLNAAPRFAADLAALVELPPAVVTAIDAHAAAMSVDTEHRVDAPLEAMTVTPEGAADLVRRLATENATMASLPAARAEIIDLLARRILREITVAGPAILAGLKPLFEAAAESYTTAVAGLPADVRPEALVRSGSAAVALYEQAVAARSTLDKLAGLRNELADLGVRAAGNPQIEQRTRVLELADANALAAVGFVQKDPTLGQWAGWLAVAGVRRLWWPTIDEQATLIAAIDATMPKRPAKKDPTIPMRGPKVAA